jgi:hypothetical protein
LRLSAEKIVADVRFEAAEERLAEAIKKKKAEDAAEAEEPKRRASQEFAAAYHGVTTRLAPRRTLTWTKREREISKATTSVSCSEAKE